MHGKWGHVFPIKYRLSMKKKRSTVVHIIYHHYFPAEGDKASQKETQHGQTVATGVNQFCFYFLTSKVFSA